MAVVRAGVRHGVLASPWAPGPGRQTGPGEMDLHNWPAAAAVCAVRAVCTVRRACRARRVPCSALPTSRQQKSCGAVSTGVVEYREKR